MEKLIKFIGGLLALAIVGFVGAWIIDTTYCSGDWTFTKKAEEPIVTIYYDSVQSTNVETTITKAKTSTATSTTIKIDAPQEWLDMFNFTNVTISSERSFFGYHHYTIKFFDGKIYAREDDSDHFEYKEELVGYSFDTVVNYYSAFTYDAGAKEYKAVDLRRTGEFEDHNPCDITIKVDDGVMYHMTIEEKLSESLHIITEYSFYYWGETNEESYCY